MHAVPDRVLTRFRATVVDELGARVNAHWRVDRDDGPAVLRRWGYDAAQIAWETALADRLAALGWPTAALLADPFEVDGTWWSLHRLLPGRSRTRSPEEQRERGRTLARLHADTAALADVPQRPGGRTVTEILGDDTLDPLLASHESRIPMEVRLMRARLERARLRLSELDGIPDATLVVHGDGTAPNLLWDGDALTGLLDLEAAHRDLRIGEFALAWRGMHDEVVHGYEEVAPLSDEERALLGPAFWAHLADGMAATIRRGDWYLEDDWILRMLRRRSPLMGPDAEWIPDAGGADS